MSTIDNYRKIRDEINKTALSIGRNPDQIQIIAVSKTFPAEVMQDAINSGIRIFGENKVQEAKTKSPVLAGDFRLHLVGHLQSNKAKDAVGLFDVIHSIDKTGTAQKVNLEAEKINKIQKILVQVNTSGEESKSGVHPDSAADLCGEIKILKNVELLGLMTIGPLTENINETRKSFASLKKLLSAINAVCGLDMKELSMGMSSDYIIAVEEGATILRIGSAIFGQRK